MVAGSQRPSKRLDRASTERTKRTQGQDRFSTDHQNDSTERVLKDWRSRSYSACRYDHQNDSTERVLKVFENDAGFVPVGDHQNDSTERVLKASSGSCSPARPIRPSKRLDRASTESVRSYVTHGAWPRPSKRLDRASTESVKESPTTRLTKHDHQNDSTERVLKEAVRPQGASRSGDHQNDSTERVLKVAVRLMPSVRWTLDHQNDSTERVLKGTISTIRRRQSLETIKTTRQSEY